MCSAPMKSHNNDNDCRHFIVPGYKIERVDMVII